MLPVAAAGPTAMWYLTRGTGTIALLLLTLSVVLGVANVRRVRTESMPRFVWDAVHRNASLLAVAFVVVHIVTSLLDGFAPISLLDTVIPFTSAYRPVWLGFGAVAFDLLIAVAVTSLVRRRLGYRVWRAVHWAAYASWPVALIHGLGTGSDTKSGWMLVVTAGCVIAVIVAVVARVTAGWPEHLGARVTAIAASALVPIGLLVWLPSGPLAAGWAKRAGTPASLLAKTSNAAATTSPSSPPPAASASSASATSTNFTAGVTGTVQQGQNASGLAQIELPLTVSGQGLSKLDIVIIGQPEPGGGVQMTDSRVTLGTASDPTRYRGRIVGLEGTDIAARLSGPGYALRLNARLQIDQGSNSATGTVTVR
jgi:sulfoxide reductase heme-binding subunit YedZ